MKTIRLLVAAFALTAGVTSPLFAENPTEEHKPTVFLFAMENTDDATCPKTTQERSMMNKEAVEEAKIQFRESHRTGFQQVGQPTIIFTDRNSKFSLGVGGYIALRPGYDFKGAVNNIDFIPYDIPVPSSATEQSRLMMDASTSRLFMKALLNTRALGTVEIFVDGDFRGGSEETLIPRLRSAYASFMGLTFGRDVTTFCDLDAAPRTIDFQGPNAYNFNFATLIRYEFTCANDHFTAAIAAEQPQFWGTYGSDFEEIKQRVPDFPMYVQYEWGANRESHFRASGVLRNPYYYSTTNDEPSSLFAWGVQGSGRIATSWFDVVFNGVYGKGVSQYIQDLTGAGLDFMPNIENSSNMLITPMWGVQAALEWDINEMMTVTGGYSTVSIDSETGHYYSQSEYKRGQYIFGNVFCDITPRFTVAAEYLYGERKNVSKQINHANRINLLLQYNF